MAHYISTRTITYLYLKANTHLGARVAKQQWKQLELRLAGAWGGTEMEGTEDSEGTEE